MRGSSRTPNLSFVLALAAIAAVGCGEEEPEEETTATPAIEAQPPAEEEPEDSGVDSGHDAGPPRPPARIFAKRFVSKVRVRPDRDAFRVGYLRAGAVLMATTAEPVRTDDPRCRGGWYELTTGGFVCNGRDVIAFWGRRLPEVRGEQPDRTAPLPYRYGRTRGNNTPMYRRLPTDEDAQQFEGFRIPGQEPPPAPAGEGAEATAAAAPAGEGAPSPAAQPAQPAATATQAAAEPAAAQPAAGAGDAAEGEEEEEEEPVTLASLQGEADSALLRRLVNGFIVSLDRDFRAGQYNRRYWRTINNGFVPYRSVASVSYPEFRGTRIDDVAQAPIGYIMGRNEAYYVATDSGRPRRAGTADFQERIHIVGESNVGNTRYFLTADDRMFREQDVRRIEPREPPEQVEPGEKWIEVNLTDQYLIAYEGEIPVYVTLISSGRAFHPDDPEADFLTPTGMFRIRAKHLAATMDGDTAADGPYSIDDVPWVMYFQLAYALHGAFWHRAFGFPRSHGCVNLAPRDAQWVFNWSDPQVPEGWHGSYPTEEEPGTWLYIHGETPGSRAH
ncbi:MAG: L,D-transpeptidase [Myxococcota bacterium]|nr:L,D-transpeptidase [Myxococcota bacterium]